MRATPLRRIVAWAVATGLLWLAFRSVAWGDVAATLLSAHPVWLTVAVGSNAAILVAWAAQWRLFVQGGRAAGTAGGGAGSDATADGRAAFGGVFEVVAVMATVANSLPFLAGQATGVHLVATRLRTGHGAALSVFALDQLAEGVAKITLLATLALLVPLPPGLRAALAGVAVAVGALLTALVVVSLLQKRGMWRGGPVRGAVGRFAAGLRALRSPGTMAAGVGLGLLMKVFEGGAILAVQHALGVEVPFWGTLLVLASVGLATMVAVAPANLGVYEASAFAAYRLAGVAPEAAAALALLQHLAYLVPMAGTGWLWITLKSARTGGAAVSSGAGRAGS